MTGVARTDRFGMSRLDSLEDRIEHGDKARMLLGEVDECGCIDLQRTMTDLPDIRASAKGNRFL